MLVGTRCRWLSTEEQDVPTATCVACAATGTNPCNYPLPLIKLMTRDRDPQVVQCSSTMIPGCPREHGLKKRVSYYIQPEAAYTRAFGSLVHLGMEMLHKGEGEASVEERYFRTIRLHDGRMVTVSSQVDALYFEQLGFAAGAPPVRAHIRDYKVVGTLAESKIKLKATSYVPQFSIQRWILEANRIEVVSCNLLFEHQEKQRTVNLYPDGEEEFPDAYLWSSERTEAYLQERLPALVDSLEGRLAPPLVEETWRCVRCDVQEACVAAYGGPIPAMTNR